MNLKERLKRILEGLPQKIKIGTRYVGPGEPVFVIAEVGINHNGDIELAKKLIDAAKDAGADAVKFQKRTVDEILTKEGLAKPYTSPHAFAPTYGEHRKKLEFSETEYRELKRYADAKNILFFASVWDPKSVDFMESFGVDAYKIPSADVINVPLLEYVAQKNKPVLLSTGMSTMAEIEEAVDAILRHNSRLIIFHCVSLYPCPDDKINLSFMDTLRERFSPLPIGYSGHEMGLLPTLAAVARGAYIVERHLTLDKTMKGSDHAASLEPHQFTELVSYIRQIEKIQGVPEKIVYEELKPLREKLAKSIVAKTHIPRGTVIRPEMLTIKGPGYGIKPSLIHELVGRVAQADIEEDSHLPIEALHWPKSFFV
jgi:sialic acid synthase SpsE